MWRQKSWMIKSMICKLMCLVLESFFIFCKTIFEFIIYIYKRLTGCSVFNGQNYDEIIIKNKNCQVNWAFEKINIVLSKTALSLLHAMLEKDPKKRITIKEAIEHPFMKHFRKAECDFADNDELSEDLLGNES